MIKLTKLLIYEYKFQTIILFSPFIMTKDDENDRMAEYIFM